MIGPSKSTIILGAIGFFGTVGMIGYLVVKQPEFLPEIKQPLQVIKVDHVTNDLGPGVLVDDHIGKQPYAIGDLYHFGIQRSTGMLDLLIVPAVTSTGYYTFNHRMGPTISSNAVHITNAITPRNILENTNVPVDHPTIAH